MHEFNYLNVLSMGQHTGPLARDKNALSLKPGLVPHSLWVSGVEKKPVSRELGLSILVLMYATLVLTC